jgi:hypothetical protein
MGIAIEIETFGCIELPDVIRSLGWHGANSETDFMDLRLDFCL